MGALSFGLRALVSFSVFFLISCDWQLEDSKPSGVRDQKGHLRVGLLNPIYHVHLHSQSDVSFWEIQRVMYESLLHRDSKTGELRPRLAKKWNWSDDKKSLTFQLREDLFWSDHLPITSWDFEFTLRSHSEESYKSIYFGVFESRVRAVEVLDSKNFVVHFYKASPSHLKTVGLNLLIYPKHHFEGSSKAPAKFPPSSGAFAFHSFLEGKSLRLDRNPLWSFPSEEHWKGISSLSYTWYEGQRRLSEAAMGNEIDFFEVADPSEFLRVAKKLSQNKHWNSVKAKGFRLRGRHTLVLNHQNQILRDLHVRKALLKLTRRALLNEKLYQNMLEVAKGPWPEDHPGGLKMARASAEPSREVKALLHLSGWRDLNKDGVLEKKGEDLKLRILSFDRRFEPFLTLFQESAKSYGVKVEIERQDFLEAMKAFESGAGDAVYIYSSWLPFELNLKSWYEAEDDGNPWTNPGHFYDAELKTWMDQAEKEFDQTQRLEILKKAYKRLWELQPDLYLYNDKFKLYFATERIQRPQDTLPYALGMETWSL